MSNSRLDSNHQQGNEESSEEMLETVGDLLHTFSDATQQAHAAGIHVPPGVHHLGVLAGLGAGIIHHHPSSSAVESAVCGAGVGLLRETLNTAIATEAGTLAGMATSAAGSPVTGIPVGVMVGVSTYKIMSNLTESISQATQTICHSSFEWGREQHRRRQEQAIQEEVRRVLNQPTSPALFLSDGLAEPLREREETVRSHEVADASYRHRGADISSPTTSLERIAQESVQAIQNLDNIIWQEESRVLRELDQIHYESFRCAERTTLYRPEGVPMNMMNLGGSLHHYVERPTVSLKHFGQFGKSERHLRKRDDVKKSTTQNRSFRNAK